MIRLRGRWLMRAGFREGDALRIEVDRPELIEEFVESAFDDYGVKRLW